MQERKRERESVCVCLRERKREREREAKVYKFSLPHLEFSSFRFCPIPDFSKPAQKKSATNFFLIIRFFVGAAGFETLAAFSFHLR